MSWTPWGFKDDGNGRGMLCVSTFGDRRNRAQLGETAILLAEQLGVSLAHLETLREELAKYHDAPEPAGSPDVPLPNLVATLESLRDAAQTT